MGKIVRIADRIEIGAPELGGAGALQVAIHCVLPPPESIAQTPIVFFCFPGGSLNRHYFDLDPGGPDGLSFAETMTAHGHACVLVDHPGIGDSERPEDGFALDPHTVAGIDANVMESVKAALATGLPGYPALPAIHAIGMGHSMGGMLTGLMQAHHTPFEAIALLGTHPFGAIEILMQPLHHLADDPEATRRSLASTLRELGAEPFKDMIRSPGPTTLFEEGDRFGKPAIAANRTELLTVCGMFSMIPGSWKREAAAIQVPLLLAFGDSDLCQRPYEVPCCFTASPDVTLLVLKDTGHNHFAFATRAKLFNRIDHWARGTLAG